MKQKLIAITIINMSVMGCATLSKEECLQGDWRGIGYRDGTYGYHLNRIEEHQQACADYHVTPDINAYQAGRDEGLLVYCTPQNGFHLGERIEEYNGNICPSYLESAFLEQYKQGLQSAYRSNKRDLEKQESNLEKQKGEQNYQMVKSLIHILKNKDKDKDKDNLNKIEENVQKIHSEIERLRDKERNITRLLDEANSIRP